MNRHAQFDLNATVAGSIPLPALSPPHLSAPAKIGPYELRKEVARGGMSVVYEALDTRQGNLVALKLMRLDLAGQNAEIANRFRREAQAVGRLRHAHVAPIHELGVEGEQLYLVMDFVSGGTLDQHLCRFLANRRLAAEVVAKIARAIQHAHDQGILHRDLKPSNVLLDARGEPLVTDFGLARFMASKGDISRTGELIGTPAYMAPEQASGQSELVGPATDVWGLGVILYELVTGVQPFLARDQSHVLQAIQTASPARPRAVRRDIEAALETIVLKCLAKEPASRYASAADLAEELDRWLRGETVQATSESRCRLTAKRQWFRVAGVMFLAAVAGIGLFMASSSTSRELAHREAVALQELTEHKEVELLPKEGVPRLHHWMPGQAAPVTRQPFSLEAFAPRLVQLLPVVPSSGYVFRADAQALTFDLGELGCYFAHRETTSGTLPEHFFCGLTFANTVEANRVALSVYRFRERRAGTPEYLHAATLLHWPLLAPPRSSSWKRFGAQVTPEKIVAFWEDERIGEVSWKEVDRQVRFLANTSSPVSVAPLPRFGPIGLFANASSGTFRSVLVRTLD